jgi:hypothetical protein
MTRKRKLNARENQQQGDENARPSRSSADRMELDECPNDENFVDEDELEDVDDEDDGVSF